MSDTGVAASAVVAGPLLPRVARIERRVRESADVVTMTLETSAFGEGGLPFRPGQFTMLWLPGWGEVPISISGDPARPGKLVHTIRAVGSVTNAICALPKGASLGVRGPYGQGWPVDEAADGDLLLFAGGLGLAPLRPAIYAALGQRRRFRRVTVVYGTRSPADVLFPRELARWRRRRDVAVFLTVDRADVAWTDHVGVVPALVGLLPLDPERTTAMICGPEVMMRFTARELEKRGVGPERVWVSLERNMKCAVGFCGRCQLGPRFLCKDGPVLRYDRIGPMWGVREA